MVAIVGGGWVIGIAPQLASAATANASRASVEIQNTKNQLLLTKLKSDYQNIDALTKQFNALQAAVPASAAISSFVTELNTLANSHGIIVKSITVSDAKPYTPVIPTSTGTSNSSPAVAVTNPKITSANFVIIPVQFAVTGGYAKVLDFVHDVQNGQRLFLVTTLSSTGSTDANGAGTSGKKTSATVVEKVDSTVGGFMYVLLN